MPNNDPIRRAPLKRAGLALLSALACTAPAAAQSSAEIASAKSALIGLVPSAFRATHQRRQTESFYTNRVSAKGCQFTVHSSVDREGPNVRRPLQEHEGRFGANEISGFDWGSASDGSGYLRLTLTGKTAIYVYRANGLEGDMNTNSVPLYFRSTEDAERAKTQFEKMKRLCP